MVPTTLLRIASVLSFFLLFFTNSSSAQVFWSENFDESGNWINGGTNNGASTWTWTTDPTAGYQEPGLAAFASNTATGGYFYFDSDNNGQVPHDVWLTNLGNPADCSGKTDVRLRFFTQYIYFNPAGTIAQVGVSTNGTDFTYIDLFTDLQANLPYHDWVEIDLDEADNQAQVWLRFRWVGNYEYHWKIDDLALFTDNVDFCESAVDISPYFGQAPNAPQVTGLYDNTAATVSPGDPEVSCWNESGSGGLDILNTTMWFSFTGDGGKYDIQTVPCNATNYIGTTQGSDGDTQMLVFSGDSCTNLTPLVCNDDLFADGLPDWRAGVTLETTPGQHYFMLIDAFEIQGVVATGEFCIQVTQLPSVLCSEGQVGTYSLEHDGFLCQGENLIDILNPNAASFNLPTVGPQAGLAWCFSDAPIPANTWPGSIPGIASTPFSPEVNTPALINNGTTLSYGKYYITPVVLGGGTLINPNGLPYVFNVDPGNGCYFLGASMPLTLLPVLSPLSAISQVTNSTLPPGNNGAISLDVSGGSGAYLNDAAQYQYQWNTGQNTKDINGLAAGNYTVTISDRSGCIIPFVLNVMVDEVVGHPDPVIVHSLTVRPNPTTGTLQLNLELLSAADIRVELTTMAGQLLLKNVAGTHSAWNQIIDMSAFADGVYLLRITANGATAIRRIVLQR